MLLSYEIKKSGWFLKNCLLTITLLGLASAAHGFDLTIPVDCKYGDTCIISNYVDTNQSPDEAAEDYRCEHLTFKGSTSTRFMVKDSLEMKKGVSVLAAEDGIVTFVRDGMDDISVDLAGLSSVRGKECGNGVVIQHRRGFITEYCHMMKGSVLVEVGNKVQKGSRIGLVGVSGNASYPQLEFTIKRNNEFFDPFLGDEPLRCGSLKAYPLWDRKSRRKLEYIPTKLLNAHFVEKVPYAMGAREGKFRRKQISNNDDKMVYWIDVFGIQEGDKLIMQLINPKGEVIEEELRDFKENKELHFQFIGKVRRGAKWIAGEYIGLVKLLRTIGNEEHIIIDEQTAITIAQ